MFSPKYYTLFAGLALALLDSFTLPLTKISWTTGNMYLLFIAALLGVFQTFIFYFAMNYSNPTVMNLIWDLSSTVLVTLTGLFVFKDTLDYKKYLGVLSAFLSLFLLY
jgi:drug/metabolite transporter (DMT)-like permease